MIEVSIVIVCMNNLKNLYPCLNSIQKYTTIPYETFVVAYLFSKENLEKVKQDFPWVTFIESNEIRGFSENNNLALRQAKGKYCYVLNDDTLMDMPVIDNLVSTFDKMPEDVAIISPNIKYPDGRPQFCGRNKSTFWTFLKWGLELKSKDSQFIDRKGCFETYNILGAAFLIKTDVFKSIGWFDEYYFFCPEDIAVSTTLINEGYKCIVNGDVIQYHIQGVSSNSIMQTATEPAHIKGCVTFYSNNSTIKRLILNIIFTIRSAFRYFIWGIISLFRNQRNRNKARIKMKVYRNVIQGLWSSKTPKEIFIDYYTRIR